MKTTFKSAAAVIIQSEKDTHVKHLKIMNLHETSVTYEIIYSFITHLYACCLVQFVYFLVQVLFDPL